MPHCKLFCSAAFYIILQKKSTGLRFKCFKKSFQKSFQFQPEQSGIRRGSFVFSQIRQGLR